MCIGMMQLYLWRVNVNIFPNVLSPEEQGIFYSEFLVSLRMVIKLKKKFNLRSISSCELCQAIFGIE